METAPRPLRQETAAKAAKTAETAALPTLVSLLRLRGSSRSQTEHKRAHTQKREKRLSVHDNCSPYCIELALGPAMIGISLLAGYEIPIKGGL